MNGKTMKSRLLASSVFAGVAFGLAGTTALAQDAAEEVEAIATAVEEDASVQKTVIVTGSLIPQNGNLIETSPVTQIGSADFAIRGVVRAEDMINTLPQAFGAQGSNLANGSTGTSSINLRGLGASRTLTLLNGRRLPYGSLNIAAPDVNFIPAALVKRVDILTGGASATYGSDAVAGVVNFVLDTEFEGLRIEGNYSGYQHNNSNGYIQNVLQGYADGNPSQYSVPNGSTSDGETIDLTAAFGGTLDSGRGHVSAFLSFQNTKEILQGDRDYSQCALSTSASGEDFTCAGSSTNQYVNLLSLAGALPTGVWARLDPTTDTFVERNFVSDTFNYNPYNHYQRPNERYSFGAFGNYDINDYVNAYAEVMFMDNRTKSQIAPSGVFGYGVTGENGGLNCDNPFLTAQQVDFVCTSQGLSGSDIAGLGELLFLRRNVEGGNRRNDLRHTTFRGVIGANGTIGDTPWGYDVSAVFANNHRSETYQNDLSIRKMSQALYAVDDGAGNIVCAINGDADPSNDDPDCAPYDIFSGAGPSQAALDYIVNPLFRDGEVTQTVVTAKVYADLADYGLVFPAAEEGIKVAFGAEYRRDTLDSNPDANFQSGDGAGQGGSTDPISGSQEVYDFFVEANVPLIEGRPGVETFGFDVAYRRSNYDEVASDTYKFGLEYAPSTDIRFRASYQRAVRAANIFELFATQSIGLFDLESYGNSLNDPCASTATINPFYTAAQCANTGVTAAQYGTIADNPAGQYNALFGGNPSLDPESSDTYTIGFVATPSMVPGLTVSLDYFDIVVEDLVDTVDQQFALDQCALEGDAFYCSLVNRGNGGTLWAGQTGYITATNINTGALSTNGFDLLASYEMDLDANGGLSFDYVGTHLGLLETKPLPDSTGADIYDCVGFYASSCGAPNPEYRHKASVTWGDADGRFGLTGSWRHYGEVEINGGDDDTINGVLDSQNYLDISGSWAANDTLSLRAGVNNFTDEEPPISSVVGTAPGNGNTYPQVYDAFGRYIFVGATLDF